MARLSKQDFTIDQRPALRASDLAGKNAAALTIEAVRSGNIPDRDSKSGSRFTVRLSLEEFPDHQYYVNPAGVTALIERHGEETDRWVGQVVPLVVKETENPVTKQRVTALHVAPLSEWDGILDGTGEVKTDAPSAAKKTARKRAR